MLTYADISYVSIRQHTSAYVSIRQHTSAYSSIRQHTSRSGASGLYGKESDQEVRGMEVWRGASVDRYNVGGVLKGHRSVGCGSN
jgi:hypothetical protein